jgi:hypothetical protein
MPSNKSEQIPTGAIFGMLTVQELSHKDANWRRYYVCTCLCGKQKVIHGASLTSGNTKSCGCLTKIAASKRILPNDRSMINNIILQYKRHAKDRSIEFHLTVEDVDYLVRLPCHYCGVVGGNTKKTKSCEDGFKHNGIDRIDSSKNYAIDNVVSCCGLCNRAKREMSRAEFVAWALRIASHQSGNRATVGLGA